jgi:hypothetical protein
MGVYFSGLSSGIPDWHVSKIKQSYTALSTLLRIRNYSLLWDIKI